MKLFKNKKGSQLVEKIMMTAFSIAAGAAVIVYGVNVINASKNQNGIDLENYQGVVINAEQGTDGILYTLNGSTYDVTGYEGSSSTVNIPMEYNSKNVTRIRNNAFANNDNITEINVSNGITDIQYSAFKNLPNLTSVSLPSTMSSMDSLFSDCPSVSTLKLAEGLTETCDCAFSGLDNLKTIHLPSTLREIGSCSFVDCESLENVNLPNGLQTIRDNAFCGCEKLKSITIPSSCTVVEGWAFWHCYDLSISCDFPSKPAGWDEQWNILDATRGTTNATYITPNWIG